MQLRLPDIHQHEIRDAARLAIQSAASAVIIFGLMHSPGLPEVYIGVLSAVLIVEPSIGSTLGQASDRFLATLVGSLIGLVCLLLLRHLSWHASVCDLKGQRAYLRSI